MGTARLQADIGVVIVHATFWTSLLFVPVISLFWPWWRHQFSRAAVSIDVLLMLAFLPAEIQLLFGVPASPGFTWFTLGVLACIPVRTVWLTAAIWRIQRRERQET